VVCSKRQGERDRENTPNPALAATYSFKAWFWDEYLRLCGKETFLYCVGNCPLPHGLSASLSASVSKN